jgi:hypothetical protein
MPPPINAVHGKFGAIKINGNVAKLVGWDVNVDNSVVKYGVEGATPDADGQYWLSKLSGWNDGKIEIEGYWSNEAVAANYFTGATYGLRPGTTGAGAGFFGFTALVGFAVPSFIISNVRMGSKAEDNKPATFRATLEIDGSITWPS